jgi:hypothetical protein
VLMVLFDFIVLSIYSDLQIPSEQQSIKNTVILPVRASHVGNVRVQVAQSAGRTRVKSPPHTVQVFSAMSVQPRHVTLLIDSSFQVRCVVCLCFILYLQLEIGGGPQPPLPVVYTLNDTKIADVHANGLIEAKELGLVFFCIINGIVL